VTDRSYIRVKALAVIYNKSRTHHVICQGYDKSKQQTYHRSLGGSVELGEPAAQAVVREIREELGATLADVRLLGVLENIFSIDGELGHEVDFIFEGRLEEGDVVPLEGGTYLDVDVPMRVEWRPVEDAELSVPLYPEGVRLLMK
jgi:ADP-ribose pyrophosphatase YjhB (NUDIX family)